VNDSGTITSFPPNLPRDNLLDAKIILLHLKLPRLSTRVLNLTLLVDVFQGQLRWFDHYCNRQSESFEFLRRITKRHDAQLPLFIFIGSLYDVGKTSRGTRNWFTFVIADINVFLFKKSGNVKGRFSDFVMEKWGLAAATSCQLSLIWKQLRLPLISPKSNRWHKEP
jgi:hypothetical protein